MRLFPAIAIAITLAVAAPVTADPGATRPYTTPFTPTGELLHAGEFQRSWSVGLQWDVALGITDRIELRLQAELAIAADVQLRVAILPDDAPVQLVVGASAAGTFLDGKRGWLGGSATASYRAGGWQLHATGRLWHGTGDMPDVGLASAGVLHRWGGLLGFVEVGQYAWPTDGGDACATARRVVPGATPEPDRCATTDTLDGAAVGVWWDTGRSSMTIGLSAIIARYHTTVVPILPLLSMSWSD